MVLHGVREEAALVDQLDEGQTGVLLERILPLLTRDGTDRIRYFTKKNKSQLVLVTCEQSSMTSSTTELLVLKVVMAFPSMSRSWPCEPTRVLERKGAKSTWKMKEDSLIIRLVNIMFHFLSHINK